jgi:hypothetical protein
MVRHAAASILAFALSTTTLHAQGTVFTVTTPSANVHRSASTGSPVIGTAPRGTSLEVTRELGSWVQVVWPDAESGAGYLHVSWGRIGRDLTPDARTAVASGVNAVRPVSDAAAAPAATVLAAQQPPPVPIPRATTPSLPSHVFGLGGRLSGDVIGHAVSARGWARGPFGVQFEFARSTVTSAVAPEHVTAMQLGPSLIYSLPNLVSNAFWVRPYAGGGANIYRSTLNGLTPDVPDASKGGLGYQGFGGAEVTWANIPQLTMSVDLRQQWAPDSFSGFDLGGFGFSLSAHWYVK